MKNAFIRIPQLQQTVRASRIANHVHQQHRAFSGMTERESIPAVQRMKLNFSNQRVAEDRIRQQAVNLLLRQSRHNTLCNALFSPCADDPELDEEMRRLYLAATFNDAAQHSGVWYITDPVEDRVMAICLVSLDGGINAERARAPDTNWKPFAYKCEYNKMTGLLDDVHSNEEAIQQRFMEICWEHEFETAVHIEYLAVDKRKEGMGIGSTLLKAVMEKYSERSGMPFIASTSNNNLSHGFFERKCGMVNLSKNGGQRMEIGGRIIDTFWLMKRPKTDQAASTYCHIARKEDILYPTICRSVLSQSCLLSSRSSI